MAVTKQQKKEILDVLKSNFSTAKSIAFTSNNTITVAEVSALRKNLRTVNSSYMIAKKTLMRIAVKEVFGLNIPKEYLQGQVGVVCSNEDAIAGLTKVNDFMKSLNLSTSKMVWDCSVFEGQVKSPADTKIIASLPSKETLLGRLLGTMTNPLSGLARFFDAAKTELEKKSLQKVGDLTK